MQLILRAFFWQQIPEWHWGLIQYEFWDGFMSDKNKSDELIERLLTGLGLVVLMAIFFVISADPAAVVDWVVL